jgi:probable HAF family extracellular repeat protein
VKKNLFAQIAVLGVLAALAIPSQLLAQQPRYKLIDMGTFGGPQSFFNDGNDGNNSVTVLNNRGVIAGWADTALPDPFPGFCFDDDCLVTHAFQWRAGVRTDLGALTDGMSSQANWISASGLIAGVAQNGEIDPLLPGGVPELRAVLWRNGGITDLGALPSGGYESFATAVNSRGQVVGEALNTVPDDFSMAGPGFQTFQTRAFLWQNGTMQDLGTLGTGPDAVAQFINERGQVVGWSYTSSAPNTSCPFFLPLALGSFIWDEKNGMRDLGSLGGTCAVATGVNDQGIVIGDNVDDNMIERGFLWDGSIKDLGGTLGGNQTTAEAINQAGQVVGIGTLAGDLLFHTTLWKHIGEITDLGTVDQDPCSFPTSINARTQIVGASLPDCAFDNSRAFLWQKGSMFDLNALIPPGASLHLQWARDINDRGEIAGFGVDASGNEHAYLLVPCNENGASDCQEVGDTSAASVRPSPITRSLHAFSRQRQPASPGRARPLRMLRRPPSLSRVPAAMLLPVSSTPSATGAITAPLSTTDNASGSPQIVAPGGTGATSKVKLTGSCWAQNTTLRQCAVLPDSTQCPIGEPAITPNVITYPCLGSSMSVLVDTSRGCAVRRSNGLVYFGKCVAR